MTKEEFRQACKELGIDIDDNKLKKFEQYAELLKEWNKKMNLTAITEDGEIWQKHFFDSIAPFAGLDFKTMADIGSGAGFPGIPVKIAFEAPEVTLIEPTGKRCHFMEEVITALDLKGIKVENARAEDFIVGNREKYDLVSARAVAKLSILLELLAPYAKVGGLVVALKGKHGFDELRDAQAAVHILGLKVKEQKESALDGEVRINLYFEKEKKTPQKYPRAYGQIKKKPLEG